MSARCPKCGAGWSYAFCKEGTRFSPGPLPPDVWAVMFECGANSHRDDGFYYSCKENEVKCLRNQLSQANELLDEIAEEVHDGDFRWDDQVREPCVDKTELLLILAKRKGAGDE